MPKKELYISIDIETDGPAPGINSMLSLGATAIDPDEEFIARNFYTTIFPVAGTVPNKETMDWWTTQPEAWAEVNTDQIDAGLAMGYFIDWLDQIEKETNRQLIAAAWPATFDFAFVNHYLWKFTGQNPLGFACLDIRSLVMGLTNSPTYYKISEKKTRELVKTEKIDGLRPHNALDDAIQQGTLLLGLLKYARVSEQTALQP